MQALAQAVWWPRSRISQTSWRTTRSPAQELPRRPSGSSQASRSPQPPPAMPPPAAPLLEMAWLGSTRAGMSPRTGLKQCYLVDRRIPHQLPCRRLLHRASSFAGVRADLWSQRNPRDPVGDLPGPGALTNQLDAAAFSRRHC